MNVDEFLRRCPTLWHVGPEGSWENIKRHGFRTAEQLILAGDIDDASRQKLLTEPRPHPVEFMIDGEPVHLRDQKPLLKRRDVGSLMGDGMTVTDWIRTLNRRVYLFTDSTSMMKVLTKYVELDGAQDVITFSPRKFIDLCRSRVELSAQNTGAVARIAGAQKHKDTFLPMSLFPGNRRPTEVTVVDGIDDLTIVAFVERHHRDGTRTSLSR